MHPRNFESLRRRLIDEGISPRYARRLARELDDHLCDIKASLAAEGVAKSDIERRAQARLGAEDDIIAEILARNPRRSVVKRHPAIFYSLGSFLLAAAVFAGAGFLAAGVIQLGDALGIDAREIRSLAIGGHYYFGSYVLVPLMALWCCLTAVSHRSRLRWAFLASLVLALSGGLLLDLDLVMPGAEPGSGNYAIGFHLANGLVVQSFWRLLSPLAVFTAFALLTRYKVGAPLERAL